MEARRRPKPIPKEESVKPRWMTGDLVTAACQYEPPGCFSELVRGIVISVQQSNSVPDAEQRGLKDIQPWSYWVLTSGKGDWHCKIVGPLRQDQVRPCST